MEKNKVMMISLIILLVALLGTVIGGGLYIINKLKGTGSPDEEAAAESAVKAVELTRDKITPVDFSDPISTNLLATDDGENHVIRVKISVGVNSTEKKPSDKLLTLLADNEVKVRDVVIDILHNKTNTELLKPEGMAALKAEILENLQETFNSNLIVEVNMGEMYIN